MYIDNDDVCVYVRSKSIVIWQFQIAIFEV